MHPFGYNELYFLIPHYICHHPSLFFRVGTLPHRIAYLPFVYPLVYTPPILSSCSIFVLIENRHGTKHKRITNISTHILPNGQKILLSLIDLKPNQLALWLLNYPYFPLKPILSDIQLSICAMFQVALYDIDWGRPVISRNDQPSAVAANAI